MLKLSLFFLKKVVTFDQGNFGKTKWRVTDKGKDEWEDVKSFKLKKKKQGRKRIAAKETIA